MYGYEAHTNIWIWNKFARTLDLMSIDIDINICDAEIIDSMNQQGVSAQIYAELEWCQPTMATGNCSFSILAKPLKDRQFVPFTLHHNLVVIWNF